jgi:hypothetical protein
MNAADQVHVLGVLGVVVRSVRLSENSKRMKFPNLALHSRTHRVNSSRILAVIAKGRHEVHLVASVQPVSQQPLAGSKQVTELLNHNMRFVCTSWIRIGHP